MIYSYRKTFTAGHTEDTKEEHILELVKGLVYKLEIRFIPGTAGLLNLEFLYSGSRMWPKNQADYFSGNDELISFDETQLLNTDPPNIHLLGWNEDDTWSHDVMIRIGVIDHEIYIQRYLPDVAARLIRAENERIERENEPTEREPIEIILPFRR